MTQGRPHLRQEIWSPAVDNILRVLDGQKGSPERIPIPGLIPSEQPQSNGVSSFDALRSLLDPLDDPAINSLALTDQIAAGGWARFAEPDVIAEFSLQAFVVAGGTLDDVRLAERPEERPAVLYFRCEHHPENLGKPFREPTGHLHTRHKGEPRFPIASEEGENPILTFFEFLSLNYDYDTWQAWAQMVCEDYGREEEFLEVASLFEANACAHLGAGKSRETVHQVKDALWHAKQSLFPWRLEHDIGCTLNYWRRR